MKILAIDPGNKQSGWCVYDGQQVHDHGVSENTSLLEMIGNIREINELAIEMVASYGMAVGKEVFETCVWIGRIYETWEIFHPTKQSAHLIYRKDVKMHLCGSMRAKDGNIRQALIDLFPATGGGKIPQIGTKAKQGPLYGVSSHVWPALGVAIVAYSQITGEE